MSVPREPYLLAVLGDVEVCRLAGCLVRLGTAASESPIPALYVLYGMCSGLLVCQWCMVIGV